MDKYVWVVESLGDDTPTLLSVHTDMDSALKAREAYIKDYRHGGSGDDYWVHAMCLNKTGIEGATV